MRLIAFIEYAAVVIGIVAMIAGKFFALPEGFHLGIALVGAGLALGGLEGVTARRMPFRSSDDAYEVYAGTPALIVGFMALLVGAAVIGAAYLLDNGTWHATLEHLKRRPAPVLAAAGVLFICMGVLMMLNPQGRRGWAWTLLLYAPRALLGFALILWSLGVLALAAFEWLDPRGFDDLAPTIRSLFRGRPPS